MKSTSAYAQAGVDLDLANRVKAGLPRLLARATRPEVLGKVGGFGGLFALRAHRYKAPVLVSSVDGVGTKLKVAFATGRHDTIGEDLVNHCVNDIVVLGAEPLFFLDYLGTGRLEPKVFESIIAGFARGCAANGCALIGGETAQMPGFYEDGEYDVSGTIVGVVEKARMLDGREVKPRDVVLGMASSGLHTNGYSLARRILFDQLKFKVSSQVAELGCTVGEELLKVHRTYGPLILPLLKQVNRSERAVKALAHITGGGFMDNIPRVLPSNCDVVLEKGSWEVPPIFSLLQREGRLPDAEAYQVFNMGIGMVVIVQADRANAVMRRLTRGGCPTWAIGEVKRGRGEVKLR